MKCDDPFFKEDAKLQRVPIPCGKCYPCRHRRINQWIFRLLQESYRSKSAHFVTLTYDTRFVPITDGRYPMTLRKTDFQKYMKRLRKLCGGAKLRYYAVGEYGMSSNDPKRHRPHYHAIVFNVPDRDFFAQAWMLDGESFGNVVVGSVSESSIAYTLKYMDKVHLKEFVPGDYREKPFALMSKGLGSNYSDSDNVKLYHKQNLDKLFVTKRGGFRVAFPRYYRNRIFEAKEVEVQRELIERQISEQELRARREYEPAYQGDTYDDFLSRSRSGRYAKMVLNVNKFKDNGKV